MPLPSSLHRYFWNCKLDELDAKKHKGAIIETLLEYGDLEAWRWMVKTYKEEEIIPIVKRSRSVSPRSKSFWAVFFHIDLPQDHVREYSAWYNRRGA